MAPSARRGSRPRVTVIGLGPGDPELISAAAAAAIRDHELRFVRTVQHPSAALVQPARSFDRIYDRSASLEEVYEAIVHELVAATAEGDVLYAVPGSPLVAERTVELLRADSRVETVLVPSMSFLDLAWDRLGIDPVAEGVRLVDGHRFAVEAAGTTGSLLVAQCDSRRVLSEIKLSVEEGPDVTVLQRLGTVDERVLTVAWADLDRAVDADHLTSVWVPALAEAPAAELARFAELVATLRERCPWDRRQTHASLRTHLLEEAYEVLDAIDSLDGSPTSYEHLEEELGDLLFQVGLHARIAAEAGQFNLATVARRIHDKLVGRHPHVFGPPGTPVPDWDEIKAAEKGSHGDIPAALPALLYASKALGKDPALMRSSVGQRAFELLEAHELGEVLFELVKLSRRLGIDPELELRAVVRRHLGLDV
jgi:tetrapyrrole methylase family protein/MazG family protein